MTKSIPIIPLEDVERAYYEWLTLSLVSGIKRLVNSGKSGPIVDEALDALADLIEEILARV